MKHDPPVPVPLVARHGFTYAKRFVQPGETFAALPGDVAVLLALKRATRPAAAGGSSPERHTPVPPAPPPPPPPLRTPPEDPPAPDPDLEPLELPDAPPWSQPPDTPPAPAHPSADTAPVRRPVRQDKRRR